MGNKIDEPTDPRSLIEYSEERQRAATGLARHTDAFYAKLTETLAGPNIKSCAYFGFCDRLVLEIMATEQERRATDKGISKGEAFPLSVFSQIPKLNADWGKFDPEWHSGCLINPSIIINDFPIPTNTSQWLRVKRSTTDIVFSSVPQTLDLPPEGSTIGLGYLIYMVNGQTLPEYI
jgi:hypothetical protein